MDTPDRALFDQLLRQDLAAFIHRAFQTVVPGETYRHNWHIEVIADHLARCTSGEIKRLIITLPPRSLKSICASVAFPAWALGRDPSSRIICVSYANDLAAKHARDCRALIDSDWYRRVFRRTRIDPSKNTEFEFMTTRRGFRLTTSVSGTLTGRGGNLIIIDDPLKADEALSDARREAVNQWFENTLYSRLDDKAQGRIVIVTQRLHVDDLVGHLLAGGGDWVHLCLPAIAENDERFHIGGGEAIVRRPGEALHPDREPPEILEQIKRTIGGYAFSAQYQQDPVPLDGALVKWTWFRVYDGAPDRGPNDCVTQSWDTASKQGRFNDYSVCTTWLRCGNDHYLLDVQRRRLDYPSLKRLVVEMVQRFAPDAVLVEDAGSGIQLIQDLQADGVVRPIAITPEGDKLTRMFAQSARIEAGHVLVPNAASWLDDFRTEVLQFPNGRHDDQIDSVSQYLGWDANRRPVDGGIFVAWNQFTQEMEREFGPSEPIYPGY